MRVQRPNIEPGTEFGGNLNPMLNVSLNTSSGIQVATAASRAVFQNTRASQRPVTGKVSVVVVNFSGTRTV